MTTPDSAPSRAALELIASYTTYIQDAENGSTIKGYLNVLKPNPETTDPDGHVREGLYGVAIRKSFELEDPDLTRYLVDLVGPNDVRVGVPFREHLVEALERGETPDLSLLDLLPSTEAGEQARANAVQELRLRLDLDRVNA